MALGLSAVCKAQLPYPSLSFPLRLLSHLGCRRIVDTYSSDETTANIGDDMQWRRTDDDDVDEKADDVDCDDRQWQTIRCR
eukprot:1382181-Amorphochlora_amoeboformis.AAC.2